MVTDALYDGTENRKAIREGKTFVWDRVKAYIPSRQREKWLGRFRYVKREDRVLCPVQQVSIGKSPHEQGFLYYFSVESCRDCPPLNEGRGRVFVSEDYQPKLLDENPDRKESLKVRQTIERQFGGGKKWHGNGLGRVRYRRKWRVAIQVIMTFLVMNPKRMVKLLQTRHQEVELLETG